MKSKIDVTAYNSRAWDRQAESGNEWTVPVNPGIVAAARKGDWSIFLTPRLPVPRDWFPADLAGTRILCLASGGGQQGPVLAALGAAVTVFDNSPKQLEADRLVAEREGLSVRTVQGTMKNLSEFKDAEFDLIVHPVSNVFCDDVKPVWMEAFRVLRPGGILLSGATNPVIYLFDQKKMEKGEFEVKYRIPYSDTGSLPEEAIAELRAKEIPLEYGHTLDDLIGGQIAAGFRLTGFYEDDYRGGHPLDRYIKWFIATKAEKPG